MKTGSAIVSAIGLFALAQTVQAVGNDNGCTTQQECKGVCPEDWKCIINNKWCPPSKIPNEQDRWTCVRPDFEV